MFVSVQREMRTHSRLFLKWAVARPQSCKACGGAGQRHRFISASLAYTDTLARVSAMCSTPSPPGETYRVGHSEVEIQIAKRRVDLSGCHYGNVILLPTLVTHTHIRTYTCIHTYIHTHTCAHKYIHTHTHSIFPHRCGNAPGRHVGCSATSESDPSGG